MHNSWVTVALQSRVSILTSLCKEPATVQSYTKRASSSWLPYPLVTRYEKATANAHMSMKVLFLGDGTFSPSTNAYLILYLPKWKTMPNLRRL